MPERREVAGLIQTISDAFQYNASMLHLAVPSLPLRIHRGLTILVERQHVIGFRLAALHTRRAGRHARNCETDDLWFFLEQFIDDISRHMAFDDVSVNYRCMAGKQMFRHPTFPFVIRE